MGGSGDGFDVHPQELIAAAGRLEGDAGEIATAASQGQAALGRAMGGCSGMLAAALSSFQGELSMQCDGLVGSTRSCAAGVAFASVTYDGDDGDAKQGIAATVHVPGLS